MNDARPALYPLDHDLEWTDPRTGAVVFKDLIANIDQRRMAFVAYEHDKQAQKNERLRCRRSFLYWVNLYGWTFVVRKYDTTGRILMRDEYEPHVPFITWPVQDAAATQIIECIEKGWDFIVDKSRDMGASWLLVAIATWYYLFHADSQIGMCSRIEDDVDMSGNPKSLFWKIDYLISRCPRWMLPAEINQLQYGGAFRTHMKLSRPDNHSVIRGEASTPHMWRGDRLLFGFFDEMAALQHATAAWQSASDATACRGGNSTPLGPGTEFTAQRNRGVIHGWPKVITLGYWNHPDKGQGREWRVDEDGTITGIAGRGFWWTPWFEEQQKRRDSQDIGQNLLIDHTTSGRLFFNSTIVTNHAKDNGITPKRCELETNDEGKPVFVEDEMNGRWFVWCDLERERSLEQFVGFLDPSYGKGSANAAAAFMEVDSGEVVAEFVDPWTSLEDVAEEISKGVVFFQDHEGRPAFFGWELNGPGEDFHRDLHANGVDRLYYRRHLGTRNEKLTKEYGWRSSRKEKIRLLRMLSRNMASGGVSIHSRPGLEEMLTYEFFDDGTIGPGHLREELTGAREAHGDRVIAYCGCLFLRTELAEIEEEEAKDKPGSMGHWLDMDETFREIEEGRYL